MKRVPLSTLAWAARKEIEDQIVTAGCSSKMCPRCGMTSLWPKEREAMNALSRKDNKTYICSPCGQDELMKG